MKRDVDPWSLLEPERRARIEGVAAARTRRLVAVLDGVTDPHNVAAVMRTAEALGLQEVHVIAGRARAAIHRRVSRGAHKWLDVVRHREVGSAIAALRANGRRIVVAMPGADAEAPEAIDWVVPSAIVFGNEHEGVRPEIVAAADARVAIPMYGFVRSFNVSVAAAIVLRAAVESLRVARGVPGDLDRDEAAALADRFARLAIKQRGRVWAEEGAARTAGFPPARESARRPAGPTPRREKDRP